MLDAVATALQQTIADNGVDVVYVRRGAGVGGVDVNVEQITALKGQSRFELESMAPPGGPQGSMRSEVEMQDFLIVAADLQIDGVVFEPQPGDRIRETLDHLGQVHVYEVAAPVAGGTASRWSDPGRTVRRIHVTLISEEATP